MIFLLVAFMVIYSVYYYINTANRYQSVVAQGALLDHTRMVSHPWRRLQADENQWFFLNSWASWQKTDVSYHPQSLRHHDLLPDSGAVIDSIYPSRLGIYFAGVPNSSQIDSLIRELHIRFRKHPPVAYDRFVGSPLWLSYHIEQWSYIPEVRLNPLGMKFRRTSVRSIKFMPLKEQPEGMEPPQRALRIARHEEASALQIALKDRTRYLTLIKMSPAATLWGSYQRADSLLQSMSFQPPADTVAIEWPILDFNIVDEHILAATNGLTDSLNQYIHCKFQLTSAEMTLGRQDDYLRPSVEQNDFMFDRGFLLIGRQDSSTPPYLLAWIGHEEMLIEQPERN